MNVHREWLWNFLLHAARAVKCAVLEALRCSWLRTTWPSPAAQCRLLLGPDWPIAGRIGSNFGRERPTIYFVGCGSAYPQHSAVEQSSWSIRRRLMSSSGLPFGAPDWCSYCFVKAGSSRDTPSDKDTLELQHGNQLLCFMRTAPLLMSSPSTLM